MSADLQQKKNEKNLSVLIETRKKLLAIGEELMELATQDEISEVWLIKFDEELIKAIDALNLLLSFSMKLNTLLES